MCRWEIYLRWEDSKCHSPWIFLINQVENEQTLKSCPSMSTDWGEESKCGSKVTEVGWPAQIPGAHQSHSITSHLCWTGERKYSCCWDVSVLLSSQTCYKLLWTCSCWSLSPCSVTSFHSLLKSFIWSSIAKGNQTFLLSSAWSHVLS